jgi:hypothetical protein
MINAKFLTLELLRGDYYQQTWTIADANTGASLVAAGDVINLHFKVSQGATALMTISETPDGNGSAIEGINTSTGAFQIVLRAATLETLASELSAALGAVATGDVLCGCFALQLVRASQDPITYAYGPLILPPAA